MDGAFIGGLRNRLRRPRPLDLFVLFFVAFELAAPVGLFELVPFLPLYLVLRVLFRNLLRRSSVFRFVSFSCFVASLDCSKQSLQSCCRSPIDFQNNDSVQLHWAHFMCSCNGGITANYHGMFWFFIFKTAYFFVEFYREIAIYSLKFNQILNVKVSENIQSAFTTQTTDRYLTEHTHQWHLWFYFG